MIFERILTYLYHFLKSRLLAHYSAMLEPSPRYTAGGVGGGGGGTGQALQIDTHHSGLETAVDLSRKSEAVTADEADQEDSEDEAPLDLKVRSKLVGTLCTVFNYCMYSK